MFLAANFKEFVGQTVCPIDMSIGFLKSHVSKGESLLGSPVLGEFASYCVQYCEDLLKMTTNLRDQAISLIENDADRLIVHRNKIKDMDPDESDRDITKLTEEINERLIPTTEDIWKLFASRIVEIEGLLKRSKSLAGFALMKK